MKTTAKFDGTKSIRLKLARPLLSLFVTASLLLGTNSTRATQSPLGCGFNNTILNIGTTNNFVTNGTTVFFQANIQNPPLNCGSPNASCDVTLDANGLVFTCPGANGTPSGSTTTLLPGNLTLPGCTIGFAQTNFIIGCLINVSPGVLTAAARVASPGAVVHKNPLQDDPAQLLKEISVSLVQPCVQVGKTCVSAVSVPGVGTVVTFTGSITNCSPVNPNAAAQNALLNIQVFNNQPVPNTLVFQVPVLFAGTRTNFTGTYTNTSNSCGPFNDTLTFVSTVNTDTPFTITNTASASCPFTTLPCIRVTKNCDTVAIGSANTISGVVSNCGNVTLTNIVLTDNLYGQVATFVSLAPGASQSYSKLVTNSPCGNFPNTMTATATSICGAPVTASATATCTVTCAPKICVTKEVACELPTGCGSYSDVATGAKTSDNSQCPSFCYRVRVTNCGQEALNNVTVVDNVISLAGCNFPTTLAVGQTVECIVAGVEHCQSVTNRVTASGVGASSGIGVSTNDTAAVVVLPISITCNLTVNGKPHETIPCDGQGHLITNAVEVCNTGSLPLSDIAINAPDLVALGCTSVPNIRLSLLPGQCTNVFLCMDMVTCPPTCGIAFSNHIRITATVDQTLTNVCSWTRNPSNQVVAITASTECTVTVECLPPPHTGCTPGFWKNCTVHWQPTGYRTDQPVSSVFSLGTCCTSLGNSSLLNALSFGGGSGVCGGAQNLLRAGVSALLNASSPEVDYPFTQQQVIAMVSAALQSCNREMMITLASELDRDNNLGCNDANGNGLPCHRLSDFPRVAPTRAIEDSRAAPTR